MLFALKKNNFAVNVAAVLVKRQAGNQSNCGSLNWKAMQVRFAAERVFVYFRVAAFSSHPFGLRAQERGGNDAEESCQHDVRDTLEEGNALSKISAIRRHSTPILKDRAAYLKARASKHVTSTGKQETISPVKNDTASSAHVTSMDTTPASCTKISEETVVCCERQTGLPQASACDGQRYDLFALITSRLLSERIDSLRLISCRWCDRLTYILRTFSECFKSGVDLLLGEAPMCCTFSTWMTEWFFSQRAWRGWSSCICWGHTLLILFYIVFLLKTVPPVCKFKKILNSLIVGFLEFKGMAWWRSFS